MQMHAIVENTRHPVAANKKKKNKSRTAKSGGLMTRSRQWAMHHTVLLMGKIINHFFSMGWYSNGKNTAGPDTRQLTNKIVIQIRIWGGEMQGIFTKWGIAAAQEEKKYFKVVYYTIRNKY